MLKRPSRGRPVIVAAAGLAGAGLVRSSLSAEVDSARFYLLTGALAATWTGAAVCSGQVQAGRAGQGQLVRPALTGAAAFGMFYGIARAARHWPVLERAISSVLRYVDEGSTIPVLVTAGVNAVAEELFFRGAVWEVAGDAGRPLLLTTAAYTASTAATGNLALVLGGAVTSLVFGAERARSGGIAAPVVAHVTWSVLMLTGLPPLFRAGPRSSPGQPIGAAASGRSRPARAFRPARSGGPAVYR